MVTHQIGFEGFRQPAQRSSWPNSAEASNVGKDASLVLMYRLFVTAWRAPPSSIPIMATRSGTPSVRARSGSALCGRSRQRHEALAFSRENQTNLEDFSNSTT
jgi:hypothetical protein